MGVSRPVLQILTRFQTKKCFFSASDFRFHIYLSLLRLERKQTNSSNPFRIRIFLFLSYSFRIETINTFIHSCSSLENHTPFQTKMGKVYTHFQTKTVKKSYPMGGAHNYIAYIREYPPPGSNLGLLKKVYQVTGHELPSKQVELEDYLELFTGLGFLTSNYHIELVSRSSCSCIPCLKDCTRSTESESC